MSFKYFCCLVFLLFAINCFSQNKDPNFGLIPAPFSIKANPGQFLLHKRSIVKSDLKDDRAIVFLNSYLQTFNNNRDILKTDTAASVIEITSVGTETLPDEGYQLRISPKKIMLIGRGAGLFYGVQSLIQLLADAKSNGTYAVNCAEIEDRPRFKYRGMHLDVSRHFFPASFIREYLDLLAAYKINTFHWHLTDDQGWRIEIKKYPRLTEIGSQRAQTLIGNPRDRQPKQFDQTPYGGFYTQDEIREIVKYAADRYITIIPEIEMPGHSQAALAAYPELSCNPKRDYKVAETWGVFDDVYCPSEYTFHFLEDVLTEVMQLFPGKYIHIGGDEVPKSIWHASPFCRHLIKKLKLKNEHGLQSYFIGRIEKFLNDNGRSIIGWDEILQGGLAPNATVMSWRGEAGGITAAKMNHDVIMASQNAGLYFDKLQSKSDQEPLSIGGYAPLQKTYAYNPVPAVLNADQQKYIIGVQANLWTEYIATNTKAEYMLLPRLLALAETAWTPLANKNYTDFAEVRLPRHLNRLDAACVNYRVPEPFGLHDSLIVVPNITYALKPTVADARIFYTTDGYLPTENAKIYTNPITLSIEKNQVKTVQTLEITPDGKRSIISKASIYYREAFAARPTPDTLREGLRYKVTSRNFSSVAQIDTASAIDSGTTKSFNLTTFKKSNRFFGVVYQGFLPVDADGNYNLGLTSDDGSQLYLDDEPVVDNDGKHPLLNRSSLVPMLKGYHKIKIKYFDAGDTATLRVYLNLAGKPQTELPPDVLFN